MVSGRRTCKRLAVVLPVVFTALFAAGCAGPQFTSLVGIETPEPTIAVPTEFTNVFTDIERTDTLRTKEERDEIIAEMQAQAESQVTQTSERIERR